MNSVPKDPLLAQGGRYLLRSEEFGLAVSNFAKNCEITLEANNQIMSHLPLTII